MKQFLKNLFGITEMEKAILETKERLAEAEKIKAEAEAAAQKALDEQEEAKLTEKDRATKKKQAYIAVINTHVSSKDIKNGFFELDWNEYFILQLKQAGYGFDGDPEEEIVDRWFRELCANVVVDGDFGGPVETGSIDVPAILAKNK